MNSLATSSTDLKSSTVPTNLTGYPISTRPDSELVEAVQTNCHIADAAHAADMTLCIYLLQMREFYRWEKGIAPLQSIARDALGLWLSERESLWTQLEALPWRRVKVGDVDYEPFDVAGINTALKPQGLIYGAGYTAPGRASFFLAELISAELRDGRHIYVSGQEFARSLSSPPAALSGAAIFLRQASLQRWLWEKYEAWTLRRPEGAFKATLQAYGFEDNLHLALQTMAQAQAETLILHELGEAQADQLLGPDWQEMRLQLADRRIDLQLRSVRDLLADCWVTLPALLDKKDSPSLHFWFSNFEGLRPLYFPHLAHAYEAWLHGDKGLSLQQAVTMGKTHWQRVCEQVLQLYRTKGSEALEPIRSLLAEPAQVLA